jgi:hypothetical protein
MELIHLKQKIKAHGEKHPKKHGEWYRVHAYDNHWLVLDTWNGQVYHYPNGCTPTDTNNLYRVVYTFLDKEGKPERCESVKSNMVNFWAAHLPPNEQ